MSNTKIIAKNTGWYGLENIVSALIGIITSIAIARTLGPTRMAYIIYVIWVASVVASLGSLGIPSTTQKYMAEFIGRGDRGTARHIYFSTMRLQLALASVATTGIVVWVMGNAGAGYKLASALVALSILPSMINAVAAQANVAAEDLSRNLPASVISIVAFFIAILLVVIFKWGVIGVGASILLTRLVDCLVRLVPTTRWIASWDKAHQHPEGLSRRMATFAWQSVIGMLLAMVVWDRSEFFLLKHLCSDIRQVAYYSVAFSMAERLLIAAQVFGSSTGATIFAQYGRDRSRLPAIAAATFRYLAMGSIPLHLIAMPLAFPFLMVLYGSQYKGAAMVVMLAPLLCLPKAFIGPVLSLLQSNELQRYEIAATVIAGAVDIGVACWLIPAHGAVGACVGSGAAQITAVGLMWAIGIRVYRVKLPWVLITKVMVASAAASASAYFWIRMLSPVVAILVGGVSAVAVLLVLFYLLRVLEPEDRSRFHVLIGMLPVTLARPMEKVVSALIRGGVSDATPSNV